jgi:predicted aspartyl protease
MTSVKQRCLPLALALTAAFINNPTAHAHPTKERHASLAWVLKQHLRAMGVAETNKMKAGEHSLYTLSAGGLTGTLEEYTAPPKYRVEMNLGPLQITKADDGLQGWERDSTGNVRIVRGPELTEERADTSFSLETYDPLQSKAKVFLHPERDPSTHDYIVDATPAGGESQTLYINPKTFLYDKMVVHQGGITGTVTIHGFKTIDGVKTPAHLDIGYAGLPVVVTADLRGADYGKPLPADLFRTPVSARDFEFLHTATMPTGAGGHMAARLDSATIPFTSDDNEVVIPVTINGHKLRFILDSGAGSSFLTGAGAKLAGVTSEGNMAAVGYGGTARTGLATHTTVDVGDALRLKGQLLYVIQDAQLAKSLKDRAAVDGALGYDVFARMIVRIDYPNRTITFSAPGDNSGKPQSPAGKPIVIPIKLENHTPTISAAVDGRKPAQFLVDTGDNGDIHLYTRYATANKLMNSPKSADAVTRVGFGIGGMVQEIITPGHRLSFGGTTVKGVTLATMHTTGINDISDFAGGIGNGILSRYAVTFDYADGSMTLGKSAPSTIVPGVAGTVSAAVPPPPPPPPPVAAPVVPAPKPAGLTLDQLMAKHLQALGGKDALDHITDTRITAELDTGGIKGTVVTAFQSPDKEYEEDKLGIMEVRQGYNGKDGWRADGNGNLRPLSADELSDLRNQIFFDTNSYVLPGRMPGKLTLRPDLDSSTGDYVVDILPQGGKPATLFFDPKTFLIAKEQHNDDDVLTVTSFSDYKPFDNVMFPTKQHISNGTARYDIDMTVDKIENNVTIAPTIFDPPNRAKGDAFVKPGATSATVHFEMDSGEIGFVALIDGHRERLLFDSGASSIAISKRTADSLKLKQAGTLEARGYGGSTDLHPISISTFEIPGAIRLKDVTGVSVNLSAAIDRFLNERVAGFVGYDLLTRFVIRLDYAHQTLTFIDPAAFKPTAADGIPLDIQLDNDIPSIHAAIDNLPSAQYIIDTGDFSTLRMYEPYISDNKLTEKYKNGIHTAGGGIAGLSESLKTHVDTFDLAGVIFKQVPAEFSLDPKGGTSQINAGSIGSGLLSRFIVTFDYPRGRIYLAPGPNATRPFDVAQTPGQSKHK